jgi:hypothetical protein
MKEKYVLTLFRWLDITLQEKHSIRQPLNDQAKLMTHGHF